MPEILLIIIAIAILFAISFWVKKLSTTAKLYLRLFSFICLMVLLWLADADTSTSIYPKILLTILTGYGVYRSIKLKMKEG